MFYGVFSFFLSSSMKRSKSTLMTWHSQAFVIIFLRLETVLSSPSLRMHLRSIALAVNRSENTLAACQTLYVVWEKDRSDTTLNERWCVLFFSVYIYIINKCSPYGARWFSLNVRVPPIVSVASHTYDLPAFRTCYAMLFSLCGGCSFISATDASI